MPIKTEYDLQEHQPRHKKQYPGIRLWDRSKRRSEPGFTVNNIRFWLLIIALLLLARTSNAKINHSKLTIIDDTNGCESDNEGDLYGAIMQDDVDLVGILMRCNLSKVRFDGKDWGVSKPYTYLGVAARHGSEKVAKFLLHHGANVDDEIYRTTDNQVTSRPKTALAEALAYSGSFHASNPSLLSALLIKGANVSKVNSEALSSFAYYAARPTARIVDELELLLIAGLSPDAACDSKGTPLLAIFVNHYSGENIDEVAFARKLIEYGANVFYVDEDSKNYLHKSKSGILTQLLIDAGLDVHATDKEGRSPLETCNRSFMHTKAETLVKAGANITQLTPHHTVVISSPFLMKTLVDANLADFSLLDNSGRTPLHILAFGRPPENHYTDIPNQLNTLEYVLSHATDVNINAANPLDGSTPLHEAFVENTLGYSQRTSRPDLVVDEHSQTQVIDMLIKYGACPQKDFRDRTPLMRLSFSYYNVNYAKEIINRYVHFEAEYYGIDPEIYKQELLNTLLEDAWAQALGRDFGSLGEDPKVVAQFWHNVDQSQSLSMSCRGFVS